MSLNASVAGLRVLRHILAMTAQDAGHAIARVQPFLTYDDDKKALGFIRSHLSAYGKLPSPDTILDQVSVFMPTSDETFDFEVAQLRNRYLEDHMRTASDTASGLIQAGNAAAALQSLIGSLLPLTKDYGGLSLFDLRNAGQSSLTRYKQYLGGQVPPVQTIGLPSLDAQGGIEPGDMFGLIGRPGSGKTWLMLMTALNFWGTHQEPTLFVTQEMSSIQVERRALPLVAGVDPTPLYRGVPLQYTLGGLTQDGYMAKLETAALSLQNASCPFLIYDSKMAGTVGDIEAICAMHGIYKVWIDGAYMLRHSDPRLNRYQRVPENLDMLKQFCQRHDASVVSSWQFKKGSGKSDAAGVDPDLDDIGYSHAIAEYMSLVLGLLENPKSVSQMNKKKVSIMKGRNGEVGSFDINWKFDTLDFSEVTKEESQADLHWL